MQQSLNRRIKHYIQQTIDAGDWKVGDQIPSEAALCRLFGASRMTVNRAVKELTELGRLSRIQGSGTFVAPFVATAPLFEIQPIRREIENSGRTYDCDVLRVQRKTLGPDEAYRTGIEQGPHFYLEVVHCAEGKPLQLERRYVSSTMAPSFINQDFNKTTASEYLLGHVAYSEVEHTVVAISADAEIANRLDLKVGSPCLRLTRRTLAFRRVITHVELIHPGDQFSLSGKFAGTAAASKVA